MAKKKTQRTITVKSPNIGETYYFRFAGSALKGTLLEECVGLSKHHNEKYYILISYENEITKGASTKYPVSIREMASTYKELKYVQ